MKLSSDDIRQIPIFLVMVSIHFHVFSQNQNIDSLKSLLPKTSGGEHIDVLFELAGPNSEIDYDRYPPYCWPGCDRGGIEVLVAS